MKIKMLVVGAAALAIAQAGPTIAPLGHNLWLTVASNQRNLVGNGGRFTGYVNSTGFFNNQDISANNEGSRTANLNDTVLNNNGLPTQRIDNNPAVNGGGTTTVNVPATKINVWCVDTQFQFDDWRAYRTNILLLSEVNGETGSARDVRYEDVPKGNDPLANPNDGFRNALENNAGNTAGLPVFTAADDYTGREATFRYQMAAWLLMQYKDTNGSTANGRYEPANTSRNQAIQQAIWAAMDTSQDPEVESLSSFANNENNDRYWFRQAATYVASLTEAQRKVEFRNWAVVSAWNDSNGLQNVGNRVQTFLTEVPEPGFYGALALGLSALVLARRNRKTA